MLFCNLDRMSSVLVHVYITWTVRSFRVGLPKVFSVTVFLYTQVLVAT